MSLSFVALDFETANARRASACSLGMTKVINGQITAQKYEIFRPPTGFEDFEKLSLIIDIASHSNFFNRRFFVILL
jgi:DNA polymerase III epsilon subunit-like protein